MKDFLTGYSANVPSDIIGGWSMRCIKERPRALKERVGRIPLGLDEIEQSRPVLSWHNYA